MSEYKPDRYSISPEGLGEINIDLDPKGEWVRYADNQQLIKDLTAELRISNQWIKELRPHLGDNMNLRRREADTQVRFNEALIERSKK
jgi:hypothetical protein